VYAIDYTFRDPLPPAFLPIAVGFVSCPCKSLHISKKLRRLAGEKPYPCGESNHGKGPAFFRVLCTPVMDSQGVQQLGVNHPGNRQSLSRLERSNRLAAVRTDHPVNPALVIAKPGKFRLH
jgi:hypothetical protein